MMMVGDKKRGLSKDSRGLSDFLFSWSLQQIFDETLFNNQVETIPDIFESVEHYLFSYVYPLLEETRAELASSMEIIDGAPYAEVISLDESKPHGELLYDVKVEYWKNRFSDRGKEPYRTLPGDIVIFSDAKPESIADLQRVGRTWTFAFVTRIQEDENEDHSSSTHFKVEASRDIEEKAMLGKSLFVVFLINITTNRRIWNSLHMFRNLQIIKEVLFTDSVVQEECDLCSVCGNSQLVERFGSDLFSKLNESQSAAITSSLLKVTCNHKPSVELIWGPPGTGKTTTVSVMLLSLLKMNCRTLACAPTNVAITQVASRVANLVKESFEAESSIAGLFCSLGDILLFGNKDRLRVGSDIEEIYLEYRVERLTEFLGLLTGWRYCLTSMIDFLEDCVSQYHIFVENESIKEKEESNKDDVGKAELKSFLEFARDRFKSILLPLRKCVYTFCTHLPRTFTLEHNFKNMVYLISLLDSLETFLFNDNLGSEELEELFSQSSKSYVGSSSLPMWRTKCLSVLRTLRYSLEELDLPSVMNKGSIRDFCFRMASLIFCTASSSYKLHSVEMEPINLLVIDEAAQLKECESTIPLQISGMRHAILVGDECQLPAMVRSKVSDEAGFGRSLFERLSLLGHSKHLLNMQYRMHPSISFFPNSKFYRSQLLDAPNVRDKSYERHYLPGPMFGPYSFINVVGGKEELDDVRQSRRNVIEVALVMKMLHSLYKAWSRSKWKLSIGIVSPYAAQVVAIQDKLPQKYENLDGFSVKVKSIDGFQGGEEDIIIISTVRSNSGGSIGFVSSPQRTNVALTRARRCLWIFGNEKTLANSESVWQALVRDAKDRQCFFNADEDNDMMKTIIDAKKELNQFEDLLSGDSVLFNRARWKVLFSENFRKSFGKLKSVSTKKSVMNLLLKLCNGWRPKNRNVDLVCENSSQILKQFKVEGLYVVSTIDLIKESGYKQVLKVWDILPLEEIPKLEKRLDSIFVMYTDDYISRCKVKCLEGDLEVPKSWVTSYDIVRLKIVNNNEEGSESSDVAVDGRNYVENSKVSESLLLMKFYSLSPGVMNHLLYDRDGAELDLPFEVTEDELEIILFSRSTFILGRSGTGKTTVLTMKLFQKEKHHHTASQGFYAVGSSTSTGASERNEVGEGIGETGRTVLRQLFVTVSPRLCFAVKQHVSQLKSFAQGGKYSAENRSTDMDDMGQFKDIPDSFVGIPPNKFPLVITFHKFLMMLDGTLGSSFFDRFSDAKVSHGTTRSSRSVALETFIRNKEVNYDKFCSFYWPHFNSRLTKKLDPSRVFTEIISHIKGGVQAGESRDPKLSKEDYVLLSEGRVSTLSRKMREVLYDIFCDYEKMKIENGDFDLADLVIDLHNRLRNERFEGDKMDFVYIDEVQDLTMGQIALFKYICQNVEEGFVFSGDTAQTIARGIDFRFEDIRSLFYNEFILASRGDVTSGRKEKGILSGIFNLSQNFRTHEGVLKLAQSIVELLYRFFPQFVDVLKPETSLIYGEAPILLESGNDENAIVTIFGSSGNACGNIVGFGAEQVILVRDETARMEISDCVGKHALLLTIVECKGLEFQDVLLYNFFGSSPLKNQWRVIYEYMKEQELLDSTSPSTSFKEERHGVMCSELKQLYVAITRTRQRLWICENVEEFSKPMFDYWKKKCLVQVRKLDDSLAQAMQVASSPEEWKARGIKLFWENNYEMATMCFERAGEITWEKRAKATGLKAAAYRLRVSNPEMASTVLREAAEIFNSIRRAEAAAECFYDLGEYERAGHIYLDQCGESELKKAGECFSLAGLYELAAKVYAKGNNFSECLSECTKGKFFDMGLQYINYWKENSPRSNLIGKTSNEIDKVEQEFLESCAHCYYELKDNRSMMKFVRAFHTMELRRNFLKTLDCLDELLVLEEESGNFLEAAEIAKLRGDILLEADLRGHAGHFNEASLLVLWYVFQNSLWVSGSKGWPMKPFPQKEELLTKAKLFTENDEFVCTEVQILSHEQSSLFELNGLFYSSKRQTSMRGKILSIWKILDAHLRSKTSKYEWEDELVMEQTKRSEERISKESVSVETLVFFWNLWKDGIVNMLEYLESIETQEGGSKYLGYGEFCLNYFGVRRQVNNVNFNYLLINSEADWVRGIDERFLKRKGRLVSADPRHFVSAARSHWRDVLLEVSMKVLETLEALYKISTRNSLSMFRQSTCLIHIFEVANFLVESKFRTKTLQNFLDLSTEYFKNVFPLDRRMSLRENMIPLRGTEISRKLLEEVIRGNLRRIVSYGQIGKVVMVLLGSGKPSNELNEEIVKRFNRYTSWEAFIGNLGVGGNVPGFSQGSLLHKALEDTYNVNWSKVNDYIDPICFLYLIERLLIMVSYFRGFFFTTKSSFVEWVFFQESNANLNDRLVTDMLFSLGDVFDFVAKVVGQFLYNKHDTIQWIKICKINVNYYYPLLVSRLFVILCLLCLSSGNYSDLLYDLLGKDYITSKLPWEFLDVLQRRRRQRYYVDINVNVLAEAFKKIGDPLVIVSLGKECSKYTCKDSIFVNMGVSQCREDILRLLFPRNLRAPQEMTSSCSGEIPLKSDDQGKFSKVSSSNLVSVEHQNVRTNTRNGGGSLQIEWGLFREFCDALKSVEKRKDGNLMTFKYNNAARLKVEVEKITKMLTDAMITRKNSCDTEDGNFCGEASNMLDKLKHLSSALDMSYKELEHNISKTAEILRDLQSRGPKLESFLNQLYTDIVNTNDVGEISETHADMGADRKEKMKDLQLAAVASESKNNSKNTCESSNSNKGKGNSKSKKPKKGKGGRNRKK